MSNLISCYLLCGSQGRRVDGFPSASRNISIYCPTCGEYIITDFVQNYFHFPDGPNEELDDNDKRELSVYVKKRYASGENKPVRIDMKVIKLVIGKESVNYRY